MKTLCIAFVLMALPVLQLSAQRKVVAEGSYMYFAEKSESVEQAKAKAERMAMADAIAKAFGIQVSSVTFMREQEVNGEGDFVFYNESDTEVRGEWIETLVPTKFNPGFDNQGGLVIEASVKGMVREIDRAKIDVKAHVLRNGTDDQMADLRFRSGDRMYLSFTAPVDGYLVAYCVAENQAQRLLPYANDASGAFKVKHDRRYVFFTESTGWTRKPGMTLICADNLEAEFDNIYFIFSEKLFARSTDDSDVESLESRRNLVLPPSMKEERFQKWLAKCRKQDVNMVVVKKNIQITKQ